jgi:hypothetical protein
MPRPQILVALLLVPSLLSGLPASGSDEDVAIQATIELYFRGDIDRDVEKLKAAFHPTAVLQTSDEAGELAVLSQPDWHERVRSTPDRARPDARILQIDRTGRAAVAKTQLIFSNGRFTDYLSLLKIDGEWQIVNKTYHWQPE